MTSSGVTKQGLEGVRPGREATTGVNIGPAGGGRASGGRPRRGEQPMVPDASFRSYYGMPVINKPVWESRDIAGYWFLGGLAGAGSVIAAGAELAKRRELARVMKVGSAAAAGLSVAALIHDLGRPSRFLNMLRTFKPTSPMSVGSWLLAAFGPASAVAAASEITGKAPGLGAAATAGAALGGPGLAAYTAALTANTAVPAWHDAHRDLPFVFVASAATSAAGLGLLGAPVAETASVRRLGIIAGTAELAANRIMQQRMGLAAEAFEDGRAKRYKRGAQGLVAGGVLTAGLLGRRNRVAAALSGAALMAGSACTRFAIFEAGIASAEDPKYTVVPQRQRLAERQASDAD
ncbi:MAG: polysulfide reductase NrfD [Acidimicrobiaceae bacterium]|nr:polysulfide reductase NrfD [Acidimicrobiaceae bacterium]